MNSSFVYKQAEAFAQRVYDEANDTARIQKAYRILFGRAPSEAEMKAGHGFLAGASGNARRASGGAADHGMEGIRRVCCLSSNEFEFVN